MTRAGWRLALAAFLLYAASGGGRIVGSDEVTMLELSRAMLHGRIDVPEGATLRGLGGRDYSKNAAGQAVLALPLTALGEGASRLAPEARRDLISRAIVSFFNAAITGILLGAFYSAARALGAGAGSAFAGALLLGFTTPLWVYAKSFMAEPLEGLGLFLTLTGAARARLGQSSGARLTALGIVVAVCSKLSVLPLAIACLAPLVGAPRAAWRWPLLGLAIAHALHGAYDLARFGTPFETGYGAQATASAYTTPLIVGLYGLLVSSGKGVLWFAPALGLVPAGYAAMRRVPLPNAGVVTAGASAPSGGARTAARGADPGALRAARAGAAFGAAFAFGVALVLYGRFQHWAGDGSFGPRYLVPVLPLLFLFVVFAIDGQAARARRVAAWLLGLLGLIVTLGGVAIYFGAEMREVGDYPYRLPLDHPHFMESSHFNPRFSPILGHWSMLGRNLALHLRGEGPRLGSALRFAGVGNQDGALAAPDTSAGAAADSRLGVGASDQRELLHALDFWWAYASYAGLPFAPLALAALTLLVAGLAAMRGAWRAARFDP
ncbi:MAG TPA: hypothetical protein VL123_01005 [Candidatus Udaeobacter sp.]|nr:hypothetical protein [Candidatus Udaeobacter sp.]